MSPSRRREPPVDKSMLERYNNREDSPLWVAYKPAFEAMFTNRDPDTGAGGPEAVAVRIYPPTNGPATWDWYVRRRLAGHDLEDEHHTESLLYDLLFRKHPHRLVYLHGHTGTGKSTFLHYFFSHYIPQFQNWPQARLDHFVPLMIPLAFADAANLEANWDDRVLSFLYKYFPEVTTDQFLRNLARHIAYPRNAPNVTLKRDAAGELVPTGLNTRFVDDTERHIQETFCGTDRKSAYKWLENDIHVARGLTLGKVFNTPAIQVLSCYYNYEFILVVDDIDDLPPDVLDKVCLVVHEKLRLYAPYRNVRFIISAREHFVAPVMTQTFYTTRGYQHCLLSLPPLPFTEILRAAKRVFFDPQLDRCNKTIDLGREVSVQPSQVDLFVDNVFEAFNNLKEATELHRLCNYNVRAMRDMVAMVFRSPHIGRELLATVTLAATRAGEGARPTVARTYVGLNRLVDILVRGRNFLVAPESEARIPNIYHVSDVDHYSATLCGPFVIAMLMTDEQMTYGELEECLVRLGHLPSVTVKVVQAFLAMHVLFSPQGFKLSESDEEREDQVLDRRDLPLAGYLLDSVGASLRYLQGMAYSTPLQERNRKRVVVPEMLGGEVEVFRDRVQAASALYCQLLDDWRAQVRFVKDSENSEELARAVAHYRFDEIVQNIHSHVEEDLDGIGRANRTLTEGLDVRKLFPDPRDQGDR